MAVVHPASGGDPPAANGGANSSSCVRCRFAVQMHRRQTGTEALSVGLVQDHSAKACVCVCLCEGDHAGGHAQLQL